MRMGLGETHTRIVSGGNYCGSKVNCAVIKGLLVPVNWCSCVDCGVRAEHYDHRDYNEPYAVAPVCRKCNLRRGTAIPRRWERHELLAVLRRRCGERIVTHCRDWCLARIDHRVSECVRATDGQVTRHELRPDIYPLEPVASAPETSPSAATN